MNDDKLVEDLVQLLIKVGVRITLTSNWELLCRTILKNIE